MPSNLSHRGRAIATDSPRRNRDSLLHRIRQYTPEFISASRLSLLELVIDRDFLEWQSSKEITGVILDNGVYTLGVGSELLANGDFSAWTADDPDSWVVTEVGDPTGNVTENPTGNMQIISTGGAALVQQAALTIGDTYRTILDVSGVIAAGSIAYGQSAVGPDQRIVTGVGIDTFDFISSVNADFIIGKVATPVDMTVDEAGVKKIGELDVRVSGTTVLGVAGFQGQRARTLGLDVVINGGFDTDSDWSLGTGWSISGGVATHAAGFNGNLQQSGIMTKGQTYKGSIVVSGMTAGTVTFTFGASTPSLIISANGSYTIEGPVDGTNINIFANAAFDGSVDNVICQPYATPHAAYLDGATSKLSSYNVAADGLEDFSVVLQFFGFDLVSKYLADKDGEWRIELNASRQIVVTRFRATTDDVATTIEAVSEGSWHDVIVTWAASGEIQIDVDGLRQVTTGEMGSGAVVINTNPVYWFGDNAASFVIDGVVDEWGLNDRVLNNSERFLLHNTLTGDFLGPEGFETFLSRINDIAGIDVRWWDLNEISGTDTIEELGSGDDGIIAGTTVLGLAGKRGETAGLLGAEAHTDHDFSANDGLAWIEIGSGNPITYAEGEATWEHTPATDPSTGLRQNVLTIGQTYRARLIISNLDLVSGSMRLSGQSGLGNTYEVFTTAGAYDVVFVAAETGAMFWASGADNITSVSITEFSIKPYTTPSALLADGATSIITINGPVEWDGLDEFGGFSVFHMFDAGEGDIGTLIHKATEWEFRMLSGDLHFHVDHVTTDSIVSYDTAMTFNEWHSGGFGYSGSVDALANVYQDGILSTDVPTSSSGARVLGTSNLTLLNSPSLSRTLDGLKDLSILFIGFKPSDHIHRLLHRFIFGD